MMIKLVVLVVAVVSLRLHNDVSIYLYVCIL